MRRIVIILVVAVAFAGCAKEQSVQTASTDSAQKPKYDLPPDHPMIETMGDTARKMGPVSSTAVDGQMPAGHPGAMGGAQPVKNGEKFTGKVLESKDTGDFTYFRMSTSSGEKWVATQRGGVKVGATVTVIPRMEADQFQSKSMNRTFDHIIFGAIEGAEPMPLATSGMPPGTAAVPPLQGAGGMGAMHATQKPVDAGPINVPKAAGSTGRTVAELYAQRAELKGKPVAVRGKVVKFLPDIMGRNWIHLQDGTGSRDAKTNDLTITTTDKAAVGDIVLVTGTVKVDEKMKMGMTYPVIIDGAKVTK